MSVHGPAIVLNTDHRYRDNAHRHGSAHGSKMAVDRLLADILRAHYTSRDTSRNGVSTHMLPWHLRPSALPLYLSPHDGTLLFAGSWGMRNGSCLRCAVPGRAYKRHIACAAGGIPVTACGSSIFPGYGAHVRRPIRYRQMSPYSLSRAVNVIRIMLLAPGSALMQLSTLVSVLSRPFHLLMGTATHIHVNRHTIRVSRSPSAICTPTHLPPVLHVRFLDVCDPLFWPRVCPVPLHWLCELPT